MVRKLAVLVALACAAFAVAAMSGSASPGNDNRQKLDKINHIVVIYEENHSFDNLYGGWEGVNGRTNADAAHTLQIKQDGTTFNCLRQNDVNLTSPPLQATCDDTTGTVPASSSTPFSSHFSNTPFSIELY